MLEYTMWLDLAAAFVRVQADRLGWAVHAQKRAMTSRSVYITLRRGAALAVVRLSDHRPSTRAASRRSLFSVRQSACGRLADLCGFLDARAPT